MNSGGIHPVLVINSRNYKSKVFPSVKTVCELFHVEKTTVRRKINNGKKLSVDGCEYYLDYALEEI